MLKAFKLVCGCALLFALLLMLTGASALAAQGGRQIECGAATFDAVIVAKVTVGDMAVPCMPSPGPDGKFHEAPPFQADDDWLQNTTIYLLNRTEKPIAWFLVDIAFPQTGDGSKAMPQRTYQLTMGRRPSINNLDVDPRTGKRLDQTARIPLEFAGYRTLAIRLADHIEGIQSRIQDKLSVPVTKIRIGLSAFIWEDGMEWNQGGFFQFPDTAHPGQWMMMPREFFPGDLKRTEGVRGAR